MKTLTKEHQIANVDQLAPSVFELQDTYVNGWRPLGDSIFVSDTYFDLAGMAQREKTLFFEGATVQEIYSPQHTEGQVGDNIVVWDVMTSEPMTDAELLSFTAVGNFATSQAGLGYQETIYARARHYLIDLDTAGWGSFILGSENQIGSLEATASDRIYTYRILYIVRFNIPVSPLGKLQVFPARYIIRAEAKEEQEFRYLMRLRRSYELQQSYDED